MKTIVAAIIALSLLSGTASAGGCGYGHYSQDRELTVANSCGYGH